MKKVWPSFLLTTSAIAAIYILGYGYIFKAAAKNIKKGSLTPSTDDADQFPFGIVSNDLVVPWLKDSSYNENRLSEELWDNLKKTRSSSLLVVRDNKLIHEHYWRDHTSESLLNSFSMAKGFLSILVGFAIDDGYLDSEDQLLSSIFPSYVHSEFGKHLTLKHLMTMQGAFDWEEEYRHPFSKNSKQYFIDDLAKQTLNTGFKDMPSKNYEYQSVSAQLLGLALRKVITTPLSDYLSEKLWKPLGMEHSAKWSTDKKGMEKAFCCIHATARDFAKIGQWMLNKGKWEGKQMISKDFFNKMLTPTSQNEAFCFSIWTNNETVTGHYFFYGFLGQFIIVIPEKNMVIVKTGLYNQLEVDDKKRPVQVELLIKELIRNI